MPLTFVHPAAVLPLQKRLGRFTVLSALVIGSLSPDFVYFAPLGIHGSLSHSFFGLFWFCLPAALIAYVAFHFWLRRPMLSLLPRSFQLRIAPVECSSSLNQMSAVLVSMFVGAATHKLWDSFTHAKSPWSLLRPILDYELFTVGSYQVFVFRVLQHSSTVGGFLFIAWWLKRWHRSAQPIYPVVLSTTHKKVKVVGLAITSLLAGVVGYWAGLTAIGGRDGLLALQYFSVKAVISAAQVFMVVLLVYCTCWHDQSEHGNQRFRRIGRLVLCLLTCVLLLILSRQGWGNALRNTHDLQTPAQYLMTGSQFVYSALGPSVVLLRFVSEPWFNVAWKTWAFFFIAAVGSIPWAYIEPSILSTVGFTAAGAAGAAITCFFLRLGSSSLKF
jgi:Domain of unknown function (DUF4184)